MFSRGRKGDGKMNQYYMVVAGFIGICIFAILFTVMNPKVKFTELLVLDEQSMMVHNGMGAHFKHGENEMFVGKTMADAKQMFMSALSDTNNVGQCKTGKKTDPESEFEEMVIDIPDAYDWRENYP
jgi:hypothetical protein